MSRRQKRRWVEFTRAVGRVVAVAVVAGIIGVPGGSARAAVIGHVTGSSSIDARAVGPFVMLARVTVATNVRGERVGELLKRSWTIAPAGCQGSVCQALYLDRQLGGSRRARLMLRRVGVGRYTGSGSIYVALRCLGRVYPHGSRVPYRITVTVRDPATVQGIAFARGITASYDNPRRTDSTPCPLGPSRDAARYSGAASSPLPSPPQVAFTPAYTGANTTLVFTSQSTPGAAIVAWSWQFGDPSSGAADFSTLENPSHTFSQPGTYTVTLTVTDANGLYSTVSLQVTANSTPQTAPYAPTSGP